ncbi:MAG: acetyl-CoA C-acyltransferase, partial [Cyanobacteria bacterium]|nr:acetyl-CoA C-acyltransferase [Cyanobacteriota bacterium]
GKTAKEMDLVEINEAFAVVPKVAIDELGFDPEKVNVNGSGISLGHPLSMTGARIMTHLVHELKRQNKQFGLGSACIGGGEGAAMIIENLDYKA